MASKKSVKKTALKNKTPTFETLTESLREWSGKIGQQFYIRGVSQDYEFSKVTLVGVRHEIYGTTENTVGGSEVIAAVVFDSDSNGMDMFNSQGVNVSELLSIEQLTDFLRERILDTIRVTVKVKKTL